MSLSPSASAAAFQAIIAHQRLLVIPHANVDPDGISSALACYQMFKALGKDVTVICPDAPPESLRFLPGFEKLTQEIAESQNFVITVNMEEGMEVDKLRYTVEDHKVNIIVVPKHGRIRSSQISFGDGERQYDLIVMVDTADLALLGQLYTDHVDLFSDVPILNIDHHISNNGYGQLQLIDPTAASATEVLYSWFLQQPDWKARITPDMATLLLTGLITDTRSFQNPNTTPRSLEVAADLLERGACQQDIIQHIYKTKPLSTLRIWGRALNRIQMDMQTGVVWSAISREDLQEMEAHSKETHGILDELISTIPGGDVYVLFTEVEEGGLKASMRSSAAIDASRLAGECFGGGGHPRAAGFRVRSFDNFQLQVLECIRLLKAGIGRQRQDEAGPEFRTHNAAPRSNNSMAELPAPKEEEKKPELPADTAPVSDRGTTDVVSSLASGEGGKDERDIVEQLSSETPQS